MRLSSSLEMMAGPRKAAGAANRPQAPRLKASSFSSSRATTPHGPNNNRKPNKIKYMIYLNIQMIELGCQFFSDAWRVVA